MRNAVTFALCALLFLACKKHPKPTIPQIPDSSQMAGGGNTELPQAVVFHTILRYSGHAGQALAFYAPEMEKRGARREGDTFVDDNMEHTGIFGSQGVAAPRDPTRPGVWMAFEETPDDTRIDIWESVPKPQ